MISLLLPTFKGLGRWLSLLLIWLVGVNALPSQAQAPAWQQALSLTTNPGGFSEITATATDTNGNVYVAGNFLGILTVAGTTAVSNSATSGFVAKWSRSIGNFTWMQPLSSSELVLTAGLAVIGNSVYVSGEASGSGQFGSTTFSNPKRFRVFITKLTDAGSTSSFGWTQFVSSPQDAFTYALAAQGSSLYAVGYCLGITATFGANTITSSGKGSGFVAKLTDAGSTSSFAWAQGVAGTSFSLANAVAVQGSNVYMGGFFQGTAGFGAVTLTSMASSGSNAFVAKLTDAGSTSSFTWAQAAGGTASTRATALAASGAAVYIAGDFAGSGATIGSTSLSAVGKADIFVAKLTDAGATSGFVWAQAAGSTDDDTAAGLAVQGSNVYLGGFFGSAPGRFGNTALAPTSTQNAFVTRLTDVGPTSSFVWALTQGGTNNAFITALAVSGTQVYAVGAAQQGAAFGSQPIITATTAQVGLLASFTDQTLLATTQSGQFVGGLAAYPNPAHGHTTVVLPITSGAGPATLSLLDALGRVVSTQAATLVAGSNFTEVDLNGLGPGIYALRVAGATGLVITRLLIE